MCLYVYVVVLYDEKLYSSSLCHNDTSGKKKKEEKEISTEAAKQTH